MALLSSLSLSSSTCVLSQIDHSSTNQIYTKGLKDFLEINPNLKTLPSAYVLQLPKNPLQVPHADVPVIDLGSLNGPFEQQMPVIESIGSACSEWGFFRIINHGVDESLMEDMHGVVEEFFDLSLEEKMKYASNDVMNLVRYGTSLNTSKKHDLHWRDYFRHYGHPFHNSFHLWPLNPPSYRNVTKQYLEEVWKLAKKLAGAISKSLDLDENYIENSFGEGSQIVASNYYPRCPEPDRTLGLAAHSDHGGITILMDNDVEGLQVKHNGEWVGVQNIPKSYVVNIGDYIEILSNGRYKSVEHRAVVNAEKSRISVAVGHGPDLTARVAPAPQLLGENNANKYRAITYKDYMRAQQSSATRGKGPLQRIMINNGQIN